MCKKKDEPFFLFVYTVKNNNDGNLMKIIFLALWVGHYVVCYNDLMCHRGKLPKNYRQSIWCQLDEITTFRGEKLF